MVRAVDQKAIERATDDASDGSKRNRRSDGWCEWWISLKERWMVRVVDQLEGVLAGASGGSARNSDGWCERLIREL